jgi:hypothetical protein
LRDCGSDAGSYQTDDSIGSSVKATKSEISTANDTVDAELAGRTVPMIPSMKATGRNTATMEKRRGQHREPDLVCPPVRPAGASCPSGGGRTMFSRTTIASSISTRWQGSAPAAS